MNSEEACRPGKQNIANVLALDFINKLVGVA